MKPRHYQIESLRREHKNPVIRWLMGDTEPTRLEFLLAGICFGLVLFKFVLELTS